MAEPTENARDGSDSKAGESKEEAGFNPLTAAALLGGAVAATAGAYFGTRALARKNRAKDGRPLNSVMAAAITACDLAHAKPAPDGERGPSAAPPGAPEPR